MKILAIETSSNVASVAVSDDDRLLCELTLNNKLTHSQTILPMIDDVLNKSEIEISDIDLIAVSNGPGSFTGLRIGVTTAKGLAHAANKPAVGISVLEAMAYNLKFSPYIISPIMDARREQVYNAFYRFDEKGNISVIAKERAISLEACMKELSEFGEKVIFLGDGVPVFKEKIKEVLGDLAIFAPLNLSLQRASSIIEAVKNKECISYSELLPNYYRLSQAEREYEERGNKDVSNR